MAPSPSSVQLNMSCWYYSNEDIEQRTPSREDGVPLSVENRYRRDGARFIITASNTLNLRYETPATGVVFFHRFFMIQSFKQFNRWVVAAACLLLAGKVEETPKKCKDVLKVTQSILTDQQMANFGSNPKEELLTHERILLQTIKFDLQIEHPYSYLLKFAKSLKGDKQKMEKLVQNAWTFVNDSLSTVLCLQWEPQAIAVAFLYLAGKLAKYDLQSITQSKSRSWWRQFVDTLDIHDLDTICHQVLDTYGEAADSSTSQDEEESDTHQPTPHQTPPSTASIPPSLPVLPSGGVGHTTSSHLPPPPIPPTLPSPMLTQQQQQQQLPPHNTSTQLLSMLSLPTTGYATTLGAAVAVGPMVVSRPGVGAVVSRPGIGAVVTRPGVGSMLRPGITLAPFPTLLTRTGGLAGSLAPLPNVSTQQPLAYSTLNVPIVGTNTLHTLTQQPIRSALPQHQSLSIRRLSNNPTVRPGGAELTPPPAKRPAVEMTYRPGIPHHTPQLQGAPPPQLPANFSQLTGTPLQPPPPSNIFGSSNLTVPLSTSTAQLRPVMSSVQGTAAFIPNQRTTPGGGGVWQPNTRI